MTRLSGKPWPLPFARATGRSVRGRHASPVGGGCINRAFTCKEAGANSSSSSTPPSALTMFEAEAAGPGRDRRNRHRARAAADSAPAAIESTPGWCSNICRSRRAAGRARWRSSASSWRRCIASRGALRLDARQHHRLDAAGQRATVGLDRVLAAAPSRLPARSGRAQWSPRASCSARERYCSSGSRNLFVGHRPAASLLHGDLWGGNAAATQRHEPVDLRPRGLLRRSRGRPRHDRAVRRLPAEFYSAYAARWPLDPGHRERRELYNSITCSTTSTCSAAAICAQARR